MTRCDCCGKEVAYTIKWQGAPLCDACLDFMTKTDAQFEQSGLSKEQFFVNRAFDILKRIREKSGN
jgi:hypothetical protein